MRLSCDAKPFEALTRQVKPFFFFCFFEGGLNRVLLISVGLQHRPLFLGGRTGVDEDYRPWAASRRESCTFGKALKSGRCAIRPFVRPLPAYEFQFSFRRQIKGSYHFSQTNSIHS